MTRRAPGRMAAMTADVLALQADGHRCKDVAAMLGVSQPYVSLLAARAGSPFGRKRGPYRPRGSPPPPKRVHPPRVSRVDVGRVRAHRHADLAGLYEQIRAAARRMDFDALPALVREASLAWGLYTTAQEVPPA